MTHPPCLILFSQSSDDAARLRRVIRNWAPECSLEQYFSIPTLERRLRQPRQASTIAVFMAYDIPELFALGDLRDLLGFTPIILILPNQDEAFMSTAYSLRPRFIGYCDGDFADVAAVLAKMTNPSHLRAKYISLEDTGRIQ